MTNNPPSSRIQPGEYGFPLKLKPRYDNFIGGDWVAPVDGEYYSNLTPVTGQPLWMQRTELKINGGRLPFRTEPRCCSKSPTGWSRIWSC